MDAASLSLEELLEMDDATGRLSFAGGRAVLAETLGLGLLRKQLVEELGVPSAARLLARAGFAHGKRSAEAAQAALSFDDAAQWRAAGERLLSLRGLVQVEPATGAAARRGLGGATWRDSHEAEQHLLHHGRAAAPSCWALSGFTAGWLSAALGEDVLVEETRCVARGDATCTVAFKRRAEANREDAALIDALFGIPMPSAPVAPAKAPAAKAATPAPAAAPVAMRSLEAVEREHVEAVLAAVNGHREQAAKVLGIGPATLYRRLAGWAVKAKAPAAGTSRRSAGRASRRK